MGFLNDLNYSDSRMNVWFSQQRVSFDKILHHHLLNYEIVQYCVWIKKTIYL